MKLNACLAAVAMAALTLAGCQQPPAQTLSAGGVKSAFVGNTLHGKSVNGDFVSFISPNGQIRGKLDSLDDYGVYRIADDGKFCITWHTGWGATETCRTVQRSGNYNYILLMPDGVTFATVTVTPGNSDSL
jgi:hypothetical protein